MGTPIKRIPLRAINFILILTLIYSCSAEKRLARLIKNNPELVKSDTIKIRDTVFTNSIFTDTVIKSGITHDTIIITKEKLKIKYFINGEKVFISGEVKRDTIIKEIPIIVNTVTPTISVVPGFYKYSAWGLYIVLSTIIFICWLYFKSR